MKKIIYIIFALLIMSSCEEQLKTISKSDLVIENFFNTPQDFDLAVIGAYEYLGGHSGSMSKQYGGYFRGLMIAGKVGTDEELQHPGQQTINYGKPISEYTLTSLDEIPEGIWNSQYSTISRCNLVIRKINETNVSLSEDQKNRMLGEVYFLRGFAYFQLVRFYGRVPLITDETNLNDFKNIRSTLAETYERIITDFTSAAEMLPVINANGRVTKYAAKTFLVKAYLQMAGEPLKDAGAATLAAEVAKDVIDNGPYSLEPVYGDIFELDNEHGVEYIFSVEYIPVDNEGGQVGTWGGTGGSNGLGYTINVPMPELAQSYDPADTRLARNIADYVITDADGTTEPITDDPNEVYPYREYKWRHDPNPETRGYNTVWQSPFNFPLTRYADVLLMYAEAKWREAGSPASFTDATALKAINQVRRRGYGLDINTASPDVDLTEITEQALLDERKWELCYEGHRWHDLNRFGKLVEVVRACSHGNPDAAANIKEHHTLFPIPYREVNLSNGDLEQNPGYISD